MTRVMEQVTEHILGQGQFHHRTTQTSTSPSPYSAHPYEYFPKVAYPIYFECQTSSDRQLAD